LKQLERAERVYVESLEREQELAPGWVQQKSAYSQVVQSEGQS